MSHQHQGGGVPEGRGVGGRTTHRARGSYFVRLRASIRLIGGSALKTLIGGGSGVTRTAPLMPSSYRRAAAAVAARFLRARRPRAARRGREGWLVGE